MISQENKKSKNIQVSIVIPIRNEEAYIEKCINSVLKQTYPHENLELILVDGCSDDRTVDIIKKFTDKYDFIKLYNNPYKTVQYALNIGIKNSCGTYIVRMDAHSEYSEDYVDKCIDTIKKTNADNVGGPMIAKGKNRTQNVIAAAYYSPFALGGGDFHDENYEGYTDTVYLGAFTKEALLKINMYDERLPRNEDDDLNFRIIENGGKIYITPEIKSVYYPRDNLKDLFSQYFQYGLWKVAVIKKHGKPARLSHLVPAAFVIFITLFSILSIFNVLCRIMFAFVMTVYLVLSVCFSLQNKHVKAFLDKLLLVCIYFILHVSYGLGFLYGIFKFWNYKF